VVELIRAFSVELQEHSTTIFALAVVVMLMQLQSVRRKVRALSRRQDLCDRVSGLIQNDQGHMKESLERIESTLNRHDQLERGFWQEVRTYMNGGKK
jgi:hypothetical protein